ncbi:MAG TPA: CDP-alcohol phosphatidyltransferase family protein [Methanosarcinaceae archaeon]|nr:CDP-alcohol phosphatidyltransferase family protein [Methanosarcinaceae archaeon]
MFNQFKDTIRTATIPIAKAVPFSPNTLTVIGLLVSMAAAIAFARGYIIMGGALILISGVFDIFDGAVARARGCMTSFGGVLDSVCDRYADAVVFIGIMYGVLDGSIPTHALFGISLWLWCALALAGSLLVSYTRARAESAGVKKMDMGMAGRPERMVLLTAGAFSGQITWAVAAIVILANITIIQRMLYVKKHSA